MKKSELKALVKTIIRESLLKEEGTINYIEYDVDLDVNRFETKITTATDLAKKNLEAILRQKLLGKGVKLMANKGPGQPEQEYTIPKVVSISLVRQPSKDSKNDWSISLKDEKGKIYYAIEGFKIKIEQETGMGQTISTTPTQVTAGNIAPLEG